jgi:predicted HTH domain antitoxin
MPGSTNNYITISYSDDVLASAGLSASELAETARMAVAAKLFGEGRLSLGQAAKLCGLGKVEFMERLNQESAGVATQKRQIEARYTIDDLLEQTDFDALADDENLNAWLNAKPVGREIL